MYKVAVISTLPEKGLALLRKRRDVQIEMTDGCSSEELAHVISNSDAIIVKDTVLPVEILRLAPNLRVVSRFGIDSGNLPMDYLTGQGIPVTACLGANADGVAEHTFMMLLAVAKRIREADAAVRCGRFDWRRNVFTNDLRGCRLLLVGDDSVALRMRRMAAGFGMEVETIAVPTGKGDPHLRARLAEALCKADYVSIHLPDRSEYRGIIDATLLNSLHLSACIINCSCGGAVDEVALAAAIRTGQLAGAGLDVFAGGLPASDSPLLYLDRVVLSPRMAARSAGGPESAAELVARTVLDALDGNIDSRCVLNFREVEARKTAALQCDRSVAVSGDKFCAPIVRLACIDSTNLELRRRLSRTVLPNGYTVMADCQTSGHGRLNRVWKSVAGANLLVSFWLQLDLYPEDTAGYSLLPSLAVLDVLDTFGIHASCKWPNDIRVEHRKLCGILTEGVGGSGGRIAGAIIGIGINVHNAPEGDGTALPPVCMDQLSSVSVDFEVMASQLQTALVARTASWRAGNREELLCEWLRRCDHLESEVTVTVEGRKQTGIMRGLGSQGQLMLEINGKICEVWVDDVITS